MGATLLLDRSSWDLTLDAIGNIAVAAEPYALAQDAASAIKTFLGECYWDTTTGIPYIQRNILGGRPSVPLLIQQLEEAALTVPDVDSAKVFLTSLRDRTLSGQVQVKSKATGATSFANFTVINPQGA